MKQKQHLTNILSLFLAILFICSSFSICASSVDIVEIKDGYCTYRIASGEASLYSCEETANNGIKIPTTIAGNPVTRIDEYAFYGCTMISSVTVPTSVREIGKYAFAYCMTMVFVEIPSSVTQIGDNAFLRSERVVVHCGKGTAAERYALAHDMTIKYTDNIYNLGDETYSFENYSDSDSSGHCFGMAVTSSGYYLGNLNKSIIGGSDTNSLYSFHDTPTVRKPICHYHHIQGPGAEYESMVAGGSLDLYEEENIRSDWTQCVNYVKNHEFDHKGSLNVGMWYVSGGGHAVDFLYYDKVGGQDRIYVYDNNFPEVETYYYMGSDGYVHQAPKETLSSGINGIDLMDVHHYYTIATKFDLSRYVYADKREIVVSDAKMYYMKSGPELNNAVMYEIPEGVESITITPLVDNASFTYLDKTYAFDKVNEDTYGVLTLSEGSSGVTAEPEFIKYNEDDKDASVSISGFKSTLSVDYKATITFTAVVDNPVSDGVVHWFIDNKDTAVGEKYTKTEAKSDFTIQAKYIKGGKIIAESEVETVKVNTSLFAKIVAFFRMIFSRLPVIVQTYMGKK